MDATQSNEIFRHIADVKTPWALTAFAIAVLLALYTAFLAKPNASARKGLWVLVAVIGMLALVPISTDGLSAVAEDCHGCLLAAAEADSQQHLSSARHRRR
jgi:hypothetical protein